MADTDTDSSLAATVVETPRVTRKVKTALHQAVLDHRIQQVRILVNKIEADVNAQDMYGRTPLMLACLMDNEYYGNKMVRVFMDKKVDINIQDNLGRSVLHYACIKGREKMLKQFLLHDDVSVSLADKEGNTALMLACITGHVTIVDKVVEVMLRYGLPIDQRNNAGNTALLLACQKANFICARILVTKGEAQVTLKDYAHGWDAKDWIKNTGNAHRLEFLQHRNNTVIGTMMPPRSMGTFYREKSMYPDSTINRSHHQAASAPAVRSLGSALRLPTIFKHIPDMRQGLATGGNSRDLLLHAIDTNRAKSRTMSRRSKSTRSMASSVLSKTKPPSTAELQAVDEPIKTQSANIKKSVHLLFKIYSERISWHDDEEEEDPHQVMLPGIRIHAASPEVF